MKLAIYVKFEVESDSYEEAQTQATNAFNHVEHVLVNQCSEKLGLALEIFESRQFVTTLDV